MRSRNKSVWTVYSIVIIMIDEIIRGAMASIDFIVKYNLSIMAV